MSHLVDRLCAVIDSIPFDFYINTLPKNSRCVASPVRPCSSIVSIGSRRSIEQQFNEEPYTCIHCGYRNLNVFHDGPHAGCPTRLAYVDHPAGSRKRTHPAMQCFFDTTEGAGSNTTFGVAEKLAGLLKQFDADQA